MRVKRYIVDTMPEAMKKIREELGKDAVILNQKEVRVGGFLGLFTQKKIEVVAAVDANVQQVKPRPQQTPVATAPVRTQSTATSQPAGVPLNVAGANAAYGINTNVRTESATQTQQAVSPAESGKPAVAIANASVAVATESEKSETLADVVGAPEKQQSSKEFANEPKRTDDSVLSEIRQMKEMMLKLSTSTREQNQNHETIQNMIEHLENQEFDPVLIEEIILHVKNQLEINGITDPDEETVRGYVRDQLEKIVYSNGVMTIAPETKIVHFVGPTGVGKTTTIAKLAALQVLEHKRKVGFITADTYRIAAVEQLRTYASILNAPIEVAMSPQDLSRAYESMKDLDIIFMDTAGRNFRNEMYVSELNTMLNSSEHSETYLVLSMTMKYKDMKAITENFSRIRIDRLLFSKIDESASYGAIVNLIHQFSIPLSYFTFGQQVPNDIEVVKEDRFVGRLMGEDTNE
jgi:flagellar biosynthesis protein FlhF